MVYRFELTKAMNGGWIVTEPNERGLIVNVMAAFTTTDDMLVGLRQITSGQNDETQPARTGDTPKVGR